MTFVIEDEFELEDPDNPGFCSWLRIEFDAISETEVDVVYIWKGIKTLLFEQLPKDVQKQIERKCLEHLENNIEEFREGRRLDQIDNNLKDLKIERGYLEK